MPELTCARRQVPRQIAVAMLLAAEVDTLEIALAEYKGLADVYLFENRVVHNLREKSQKPLLWPAIRHHPRFKEYSVRFHECKYHGRKEDANRKLMWHELWPVEHANDECISARMQSVANSYDIIVVGSLDEILSREIYAKLKYCATDPQLPRSSAIGMPEGLLGRSFKTDWHVPDMPLSHSLPIIYPGQNATRQYVRHFKPLPGMPIVGGLHATNYCFLPQMIIKELTATEYNHAFDVKRMCQEGLRATKQRCYDYKKDRHLPGVGPETVVPWLLRLNPDRYPAWRGDIDPRETVVFKTLCSK